MKAIARSAILFLGLYMFCVIGHAAAAVPSAETNCKGNDVDLLALKERCLQATLYVIDHEMDRYGNWVDFEKQQGVRREITTALQDGYHRLEQDQKKYLAMEAASYPLPERVNVTGWIKLPVNQADFLYIAGATPAGPWYYFTRAGISPVLHAGQEYALCLYPLYPRVSRQQAVYSSVKYGMVLAGMKRNY